MIFSKRLLSLLLTLAFVASCSFGTKDKDESKGESALQLSRFLKVNTRTLRAEGSTSLQVAKDIQFQLLVCLKDPTGVRNLNAKSVTISGIQGPLTTDASGCVTWNETRTINYAKLINCSEITRTLAIPSEGANITLKYSLDPTTATFIDLTKAGAVGCQKAAQETLEKNDVTSKLILDEVRMSIKVAATLERRSDTKFQEYQMEFSSCIYAKRTEAPIKNRKVEVTIQNPETSEKIKTIIDTNHKGCFKNRIKAIYEQHNYSHWMNANFSARILDGVLKDEVVATTILLNPWDNDLVDARFGKAEENPIKKTNQFQIDGVMYILIGNNVDNFKVNNHLNLTIAKTYQIVLSPRVDRGHRFNTQRYSRLDRGKFKLKFMLLAPNHAEMEINETNFDQFTYITGAEKEVEVINGTINTLIDLPIKVADLPRLALRTVSIFKLEPIDENIGLRSKVVTGFFKAKIPWIKTNVMSNEALNDNNNDSAVSRYTPEKHNSTTTKVNNNILEGKIDSVDFFDVENMGTVEKSEEDVRGTQFKNYVDYLFENINYFTEQRAFASKFKASALDIYVSQRKAKNKNFEYLDIEDAQKLLNTRKLENRLIYIAKQQYKTGKINLLSGGQTTEQRNSFKASICTLALGKSKTHEPAMFGGDRPTYDFKRCIKDPSLYMDLEVKRHVDKIVSSTPKYSNGFNFAVGSRFSIYKGSSETEYTSIRSGIDAAIKIPFGEFFGLGVRLFDVSKGINYNDYENETFGDDVSESKSIGIEKFVLDVEANYNHCLLLKSKGYKNARTRSRSTSYGTSYQGRKIKSFGGKDYYFCSRPYKDTLEESWYYLQSFTSGASYFRDSFGPTEIKLIKVIRGYKNYLKFRSVLRDETKHLLYMDSTGLETPDKKIYDNWKHLVDNETREQLNEDDKGEFIEMVIDNAEGSLPGTIE
ncbi:hypothetical protein A9Q84_15725 [Halobacteriovorax marinus]|uniref:Lipoprotein n=1 Tax=Halobacteriovorax marinus TaxID=97084 RepID=A0A1Y5F3X8_9BACT|nr:hypothetical protein A9Q84_15725 [Halobacteriovorax marinus]